MLHLYNTLTRKKEAFHPREGKQVKLFVCGPTVYDYSHIGHARTYVAFDVIARYLRQQGYAVTYLQNITDIDDRIIERAQQNKKDWQEISTEFTNAYHTDMKALGIDGKIEFAVTTDFIPQVVSQVKRLLEKGMAYKIEDDGYYFDLSKFSDYGKLSGRKALAADDAVSRIDESINKHNAGDFCLWKFSRPGAKIALLLRSAAKSSPEPAWDWETGRQKAIGSTPEQHRDGDGRPGWHIEDTAITEHFFGSQYDIHGGARDLIFPHHEAEIAQMESISGQVPLAKYWLHTGFLTLNGQKMSKSLGNFITIRDLLEKYDATAIRLLILSTHYRSPIDYTEDSIKAAAAGVQRISELISKLSALKANPASYDAIGKLLSTTKQEFATAMDDDFNTAQALAGIFKLIREVNTQLRDNRVSDAAAQEILALLGNFNQVLGIIPTNIETVPGEITQLIETRELLRRDKRYSEADDVRAQITAKGYRLDDTSNGPLISCK